MDMPNIQSQETSDEFCRKMKALGLSAKNTKKAVSLIMDYGNHMFCQGYTIGYTESCEKHKIFLQKMLKAMNTQTQESDLSEGIEP
jgi:single-stranded DNA-specific DHH superfamily exonuclease